MAASLFETLHCWADCVVCACNKGAHVVAVSEMFAVEVLPKSQPIFVLFAVGLTLSEGRQ
jgi:hypothetical protein